ncbi:MAG: hypothetical protein HY299_11225 [Verrucomicrobia bacterium]|nr:hypothetical protein [Verrucomicrobiota bacterium]
MVQKVTLLRFDTVMADPTKIGPNTCVHLGPGTFITAGYYEGFTGGAKLQPGMRLVGSGMDVTILRRVNSVPMSVHAYAIGHALTQTVPTVQPNLMDFCEIAEMTIDCNFGEVSNGQAAAGAIRMMGNHSRVVRVKIVNWGGIPGIAPSFGILVITGNTNSGDARSDVAGVVNCGIQECIAINPGLNSNGTFIALQVGAKETPGTVEAVGVGPYIVNNYVEGLGVTSAKRVGLGISWCTAGVVEGNQVEKVDSGLGMMYEAGLRGVRDATIRNNAFRSVGVAIGIQATTESRQDVLIHGNWFSFSASTRPVEIQYLGTPTTVPGNTSIRGNRFSILGASQLNEAAYIQGATTIQVGENILDPITSGVPALYFSGVGAAKFFENRTTDGTLVRGYNSTTSQYLGEMATDVEDALVLGLMQR